MENNALIGTIANVVKPIIKQALNEHDKEKLKAQISLKVYSFNEARKILGCSHTTVKNLVKSGYLKTTSDQRKIPAWSLNEYLNIQK